MIGPLFGVFDSNEPRHLAGQNVVFSAALFAPVLSFFAHLSWCDGEGPAFL